MQNVGKNGVLIASVLNILLCIPTDVLDYRSDSTEVWGL